MTVRLLHITTLPITMRLFVVPLAHALTDLGYQVDLAYGGSTPVNFAPLTSYHFPLSRNPGQPTNGVAWWQLVKLMQTNSYQAVHVHTPVAGVIGRLAAAMAGVPRIIYTLHGSFWDTQPAWRAKLFDSLERWLAPLTSHVFVFNHDDYLDLRHRCYFKSTQLTRLPVGGAGVDLSRFSAHLYPPQTANWLRQNLGIEETEVVIGYIGRLDRDKGITELLQAFRQLHPLKANLRLLLVGDRLPGDRDVALNSLLTDLGSTVICTGFREDIPAILSAIDIVVSPSHRDGFGMILAEAAAMEKPVVATGTRGARSAVLDGLSGLLIPIGDITALRNALKKLIDHKSLRLQMGSEAQQLATALFDRELVMKIYQATYQRLLKT